MNSDTNRYVVMRTIVLATLSISFLALIAVTYDPELNAKVKSLNMLADVRTDTVTLPISPKTQPIENVQIESSSDNAMSKAIAHEGSDRKVKFSVCRRKPVTCVVDGDTFWLDSVKIRIADIDTPEVRTPQCAAERALGIQATNRLIELLNAGPFELRSNGGREYDRYGRLIRLVVRDGKSLGEQLVDEGLAHTWIGHKESWCYG